MIVENEWRDQYGSNIEWLDPETERALKYYSGFLNKSKVWLYDSNEHERLDCPMNWAIL